METTLVRLFRNGQSQAVRIPKALEFEGVSEVEIRRDGDALVLRPARASWTSLADLPAADADFMSERPDLLDPARVDLDGE